MIETSNDVVIVNEFIGNLGLMCYCSRRIMCALTPAASTPVLVLQLNTSEAEAAEVDIWAKMTNK